MSTPRQTGREERVRALVEQLDSLLDGAEAAARLVGCGDAAIEPLRRFLIDGRPRGVFQPRLWAVQALAGLGADDVLLEYLRQPTAEDPVVRFAEEAVRNAAARTFAGSDREDVRRVLFQVARDERLPGALETLASIDPMGAVPILLESLGEDFARDAAVAALRRRGTSITGVLIDVALDPGTGTASALKKRLAVLGLLAEAGVDLPGWGRLEPLLDDDDAQIVTAVGLVGTDVSPDPGRVARRLLEVLPNVGWEWLGTLEDLVVRCAERAGGRGPWLRPPETSGALRPGVVLTWRRICRRVAALQKEA